MLPGRLARLWKWLPSPKTPLKFVLWLCAGAAALLLCSTVIAVSGLALLVQLQGVPIVVVMGGQTHPLNTYGVTVAEALTRANVMLYVGDQVQPAAYTPIQRNMVIMIRSARDVLLTVDGETRVIRTAAQTPSEVLRAANISVTTEDRININGQAVTMAQLAQLQLAQTHTQIRIQRAKPITVTDTSDGVSRTLISAEMTVGEALFDAGYTILASDTVQPPLTASLQSNMTIMLQRAMPITFTVDGNTFEARVSGQRVIDAISEAGLSLNGMDYSVPHESEALTRGMNIRIVRVMETVVIQQEALPFHNLYQADGVLELDQRRVVTVGQAGLQRISTRIRLEDGMEVSRVTEEAVLVRPSVDGVVAYGTQVVMRTIDTPDGPQQYWRVLRMYATSYHPAALGGDDITATGRRLTKGVVGINPNIIPYGTQLYVVGYGVGVAADTGGPRTSPYWIDLGYDDANYVGWARYVDVYLIGPPPANIDYLLPDWRPLRGTSDG
jgi:resuscitation-promoting factor RpfB